MEMTPREIAHRYNQADQKSKMMTILAELNACSRKDIRQILIDEGALPYLNPKEGADRPKPNGRTPRPKNEKMAESIGKHIELYLLLADINKGELAKRLHIQQNTLTSYLTGERTPSTDTLIAMADEFELSLDDLVGRKGWRKKVG